MSGAVLALLHLVTAVLALAAAVLGLLGHRRLNTIDAQTNHMNQLLHERNEAQGRDLSQLAHQLADDASAPHPKEGT